MASSYYSYYDGEYYNSNSNYTVNYNYPQVVPPFMSTTTYNQVNQPYYDEYDSFAPDSLDYHSYQTISYSAAAATSFNEPKSIVYYDSIPPNYGMTTHLLLSYSNLEFNEPAYDEYDPTPYGGGYDIANTYGKPLPPSDKICYPRSASITAGSVVPIPLMPPPPIVEEEIVKNPIKPQIVTEEAKVTEEANKPQLQDSNITDLKPNYEKSDGEDHEDYGSGFDNGYSSGGHFDFGEQEKQVPSQYPSGYGLESLDLCESLFGHWPCLSKMKRGENCGGEGFFDRGNNFGQENMWKGTADYLFGNPYPYGGNGSSHGGGELALAYGYQSHYPFQADY